MINQEMQTYKVETFCNIYGKQTTFEKAYTPFDSAEKAQRFLNWRKKEQLIKQIVTIQDGTKRTWIFENERSE